MVGRVALLITLATFGKSIILYLCIRIRVFVHRLSSFLYIYQFVTYDHSFVPVFFVHHYAISVLLTFYFSTLAHYILGPGLCTHILLNVG